MREEEEDNKRLSKTINATLFRQSSLFRDNRKYETSKVKIKKKKRKINLLWKSSRKCKVYCKFFDVSASEGMIMWAAIVFTLGNEWRILCTKTSFFFFFYQIWLHKDSLGPLVSLQVSRREVYLSITSYTQMYIYMLGHKYVYVWVYNLDIW